MKWRIPQDVDDFIVFISVDGKKAQNYNNNCIFAINNICTKWDVSITEGGGEWDKGITPLWQLVRQKEEGVRRPRNLPDAGEFLMCRHSEIGSAQFRAVWARMVSTTSPWNISLQIKSIETISGHYICIIVKIMHINLSSAWSHIPCMIDQINGLRFYLPLQNCLLWNILPPVKRCVSFS